MPVVAVTSGLVGPCEPYITAAELVADDRACDIVAGPDVDDIVAQVNSELFVLLGYQFPGVCTATVRPTADCFDPWPFDEWGVYGGCGDCHDAIPLAFPIVEIIEVRVDGVVLTYPDDWAVRDHFELVRLGGKDWPRAQNIYAANTATDTFSITYTFGAPVPALVKRAAKEFAVNTWLEFSRTGNRLPVNTTSANRQGLSLSLDKDRNDTGSNLLAQALALYNPNNQRMLSRVWSPDSEWTLNVVGRN